MLNPAQAKENEQIIPCKEGGAIGCVSDYFGNVNLESSHPSNATGENTANQCGGSKQKGKGKNKGKGKGKNKGKGKGKNKGKNKGNGNHNLRGGAYYGFTGNVNNIANGVQGTYPVETIGNHCGRVSNKLNLGAAEYASPSPVGQSAGFAASEQAKFPENALPSHGVSNVPPTQNGGYSSSLDGYNYPGQDMVNNTGIQDPAKMYGNPLLNGSASSNTTNFVSMEPGPENFKFHGSGYPKAEGKQRGGARKSRKASKKQSKRGRKSMKKRKSQRKHMKKSNRKSMKKRKVQRKNGRKSMKKRKSQRKVQRGGSGMQLLSPHTFNEVGGDTTQQIKGDNAPPSEPTWADKPAGSGYSVGGKSLVEGKSWMGTSPGPHTRQNGVGKGACVNNYNHYKMKGSVVKSNN